MTKRPTIAQLQRELADAMQHNAELGAENLELYRRLTPKPSEQQNAWARAAAVPITEETIEEAEPISTPDDSGLGWPRRIILMLLFAMILFTGLWLIYPFVHPSPKPTAKTETAPALGQAVSMSPDSVKEIMQDAHIPPEPIFDVELIAHQRCWAEVNRDGETAFSGFLKAEYSIRILADKSLTVRDGCPGNVDFHPNGGTVATVEPGHDSAKVEVVKFSKQ